MLNRRVLAPSTRFSTTIHLLLLGGVTASCKGRRERERERERAVRVGALIPPYVTRLPAKTFVVLSSGSVTF
jgi:hypothetical protein